MEKSNRLRNRVADSILFSLVDTTEQGNAILEKNGLVKWSHDRGWEKSAEAFLMVIAAH